MTVLARLLPASTVAVETRGDLVVDLLPAEERALGRAVAKRRREFVTGRACARRALDELGITAFDVGAGSAGEPRWPRGVVGSITHCAGYRACAVGRADDVRAIGIDAEPDRPLDAGVWDAVAHGPERSLRRTARDGPLDVVLFGAKEAVYKAWWPSGGRRLGFEDAIVELEPRTRRFAARVRGDERDFVGRWAVSDGIVVTAVIRRAVPDRGSAVAYPAASVGGR